MPIQKDNTNNVTISLNEMYNTKFDFTNENLYNQGCWLDEYSKIDIKKVIISKMKSIYSKANPKKVYE